MRYIKKIIRTFTSILGFFNYAKNISLFYSPSENEVTFILKSKIHYSEGRYNFALLNAFFLAGYTVNIKFNFNYCKGIEKYEWLFFRNRTYRICLFLKGKLNNKIVITDDTCSDFTKISFDVYNHLNSEFVFPFDIFPINYFKNTFDISKSQNAQRKHNILFAGNTSTNYRSSIKLNKFKLIDRVQLFETLKSKESSRFTYYDGIKTPKSDLLIAIWNYENINCKIESTNYFQILSNCNFIVAPPGVEMPMCHNLIEAMKVGTIPILQYSSYLYPALTDGHNCLTFNDKSSFLIAIKTALDMNEEFIERMRNNVIEYANNHLDHKRFIDFIAKTPQKDNIFLYGAGISDEFLNNDYE